jgi:hypothetical protein
VSAAINIATKGIGNPYSWEEITDYTAVVIKWASSTKTVSAKAAEH